MDEVAGQFVLNLPSTSERIRVSCGDPIALECLLPSVKNEDLSEGKEALSVFQPKEVFEEAAVQF